MMRRQGDRRDVLPVCLLASGRRCVVVGGGTVATRKIQSLLEAAAVVVVVCPELSGNVATLVASGTVTHLARGFEDADVEGAFLVFAATNDRSVNKRVVAQCHAQGILCCSVDANWADGDFMSPATLREGGVVVAVSTGGKSCRRSRLLKDSFKRHLATVESAELLVIGTSHHQLHVDRREPFHLVGPRLIEAGDMLRAIWGVQEFVLLNTCNRIEFMAIVSREAKIEGVLKRVLGFDHLANDECYIQRGYDAFAHVATVVAGLQSQTPGEQHIVAQVKEALDTASRAGWAGGMMQEWIAAAFRVARDIRTATKPLLRDFEIEDSAVEFLLATRPGVVGTRILVLGAGDVGTGVVERCVARQVACDWCYHREKPVLDPAWKDAVRLCTFNDLRDRLPEAQVVVCATASPGYVLHKGHAPFFDQEKDVLIIDLAMPRNVEPSLDGLTPNLRVIDLEDLKHWHRREIVDMAQVQNLAARSIAAHKDLYDGLVEGFQNNEQ